VKSDEIRESFLSFFESKGSTRVPSSSLIPDDPSLLLTTAGMVQFKPVFQGLRDPGYTRAASCQKCVRTTDIDIVGHTGRHQTFFEMLGNFSFGDYFKSEACAWAYEFSVDILELDPQRLWFSIFEDDDEAAVIWVDEIGVPAERVVRLGEKDNFWSAGPTGPCGPCSELYYDQGEEVGCGSADCAPGCDCDRFVEYWNLVFMQFDRQEDGSLQPLPKQNIDTGAGLERIAAITQGVTSNFETDLLRGVMTVAEKASSVSYGDSEKTDVSLRILADHARSVSFLIADSVLPSNEGRGYVLRRLLRRAIRHGRLLGLQGAFLMRVVDVAVDLMKGQYPELGEHHELIRRIVDTEEERFGATLRQGLVFLEDELTKMKSSGSEIFDGKVAFTLHDTYGFPVELTAEIAAERDIGFDLETFETEMKAQQERGRAHVKDESWIQEGAVFEQLASEGVETEFLGYEKDEASGHVLAIVSGGVSAEGASAGEVADIVLDRAPFYGEQGGQVGDSGLIEWEGGRAKVSDAQIPARGMVALRCEIAEGSLAVGDEVTASIDRMRRERIRRNHTATHLLHWALRLILGEHVRQSGSYVAPDRLRFDFTHFEAPSAEEMSKIERLVNAKIMENHRVIAYETSLKSAKEAGVTALFGEKYGKFVRVLEVGNFSKELCGGTHVARTSEIGFVKIVSEGSVGANLRRIEAVTSFDAMDAVYADKEILGRAAESMKVQPGEVAEKVESLQHRLKEVAHALEDLKRQSASGQIDELLSDAKDAGGYKVIVAQIENSDRDGLMQISDLLRAKMGGGAVVLATASADSGKPFMIAAGSKDAVAAGFDAGEVIRAVAPSIGGRGGGKASMAQAGGEDASGMEAALAEARRVLGLE